MRSFKLIVVLFFLGFLAINAEAKWWIFGQSNEGVSTRYIYLNDLSYDELGDKVTLYQENLPQGKIYIRGKGTAGKNKVGAVQVRLGAEESWQKASLTADGNFVFSFVPVVDQKYEIYVKVMDTAGKSNNIEASRKEVVVTDQSIQALIYQTMDKLVKAYQDEDSFSFMRLISDDFVSGAGLLDVAISHDFTLFDDIQISYTLSNITNARQGKIFVAVHYNRMVTSSRTGETFTDSAPTEFVFKMDNGVARIYSMKNPLIFGLSDASEIATGTVNTGTNSQVLAVDSTGTVALRSLEDVVSGSPAAESSVTGSFILTVYCMPPCSTADGFNFAQNQKTTLIADSDIYKENNLLWGNGAVTFLDMGSSFSGVTVPEAGAWTTSVAYDVMGPVFAVKRPDNTYALIKFTGDLGGDQKAFDYKYNPAGSRDFQ